MRNPARLLLLAPLVALSLAGCERKPAPGRQQQQSPEVPTKSVDRSHAGRPIPATELFNPDEEKSSIEIRPGKPMLVNLWASWCVPCVKELPTLDALSREPGAPAIVVVSEDIADRESVEAFLEQHGIRTLESWRDPEMAFTGALGVQVMPTSVYYDSSGHEVWRFVGDLDWTGEEATSLLREGGNGASSK